MHKLTHQTIETLRHKYSGVADATFDIRRRQVKIHKNVSGVVYDAVEPWLEMRNIFISFITVGVTLIVEIL